MLGWFASDFFARSPVLIYPVIALGLFMTVFISVSLKALFLKKSEVDRLAQLPLSEDD